MLYIIQNTQTGEEWEFYNEKDRQDFLKYFSTIKKDFEYFETFEIKKEKDLDYIY